MSEIKDDPREVLVLLNSLGFVGITATQLKAFMKDLKIYRKIKERERQQRKEEIKTKIINKQQALFKETHNIEYSSNNIVASESSNSLDDESVVKVRVRCLPKKDIQNRKHFITAPTKSDEKSKIEYDKEDFVQIAEYDSTCEQNYFNTKYSIRDSKHGKQNISKCLVKNSHLDERCKQNLKIEQMKPMTLIHEHTSAPVLSNHESKLGSRSVISDVTGNICVRSALSARSSINSGHKSFIRPWRLQLEAQKNFANKKCDPVALYHKYQEEWKQISFPGEAKHSKIRWAVREKMLGADPHPVPLPKKSANVPIRRK